MYSPEMERIPCVIMRSGTSKGIYLLSNDLPEDPETRDKVILSVFGSPDSRQIDGLGGADPLTSKLAVISVSDREDADIDYTFGQVEIKKPYVDYSSNCGNISAGVGPFAIQQGLVKAVEPVTTVRIYNTNTKKVFVAEVPVKDGKPQVKGDYKVDGVPGTGARIGINMAGTIGAKTGRLLPTGNTMDTLEIDGDPRMLELLEEIRTTAAVVMGIAPDQETARTKIRAVPMVAFVSPSQDYASHIDGAPVSAADIDFVSRDMFMGIMHKTYSGTATVCTGCAAVTLGTIVNEAMGKTVTDGMVRIGHPGGVIECDMSVRDGKIVKAAYGRTARRIMEGYVYVPREILD